LASFLFTSLPLAIVTSVTIHVQIVTSVTIHVQIATSVSIQVPLSLSQIMMCTLLLVWFCQFLLVGPLVWFPYVHELFLVILVPSHTSVV